MFALRRRKQGGGICLKPVIANLYAQKALAVRLSRRFLLYWWRPA